MKNYQVNNSAQPELVAAGFSLRRRNLKVAPTGNQGSRRLQPAPNLASQGLATTLFTLYFLLFTHPLFSYTLTYSNIGGSGDGISSAAGGNYSLRHTFSQNGIVGEETKDNIFVRSGFLKSFGLPPAVVSIRPSQGILRDLSAAYRIEFDTELNPDSAAEAVKLTAVKNKLREDINLPVNITPALSSDGMVLEFQPADNMGHNTIYALEISTGITDIYEEPMEAREEVLYQTPADPVVVNAFSAWNNENLRAVVEGHSFASEFYLAFSTDPFNQPLEDRKEELRQANFRLAQDEPAIEFLSYFEVRAFDTEELSIDFLLKKPYEITLPFSEAGTVSPAYSAPGSIKVGNLLSASQIGLYAFDTKKGRWNRMPGVSVDNNAKLITTKLPYFANLAIMRAPTYYLGEAYAYPVPFTPNTDLTHTNITFNNLCTKLKMQVFTVSGELVWEGEKNDYLPDYSWDVKTKSGEGLASGVYIYLLTSRDDKKIGKIVIIK